MVQGELDGLGLDFWQHEEEEMEDTNQFDHRDRWNNLKYQQVQTRKQYRVIYEQQHIFGGRWVGKGRNTQFT